MFQLKVQKIMDFENIRKRYNGCLCDWGVCVCECVCVCVCERERERERERCMLEQNKRHRINSTLKNYKTKKILHILHGKRKEDYMI